MKYFEYSDEITSLVIGHYTRTRRQNVIPWTQKKRNNRRCCYRGGESLALLQIISKSLSLSTSLLIKM